jgi:hypothetical protein
MLVPTQVDEQMFEGSLPTEAQPWEADQAENDWPSDQQRVETVSWQSSWEEPSEDWTEETLPGPDDRGDDALPPLSELDLDTVDF